MDGVGVVRLGYKAIVFANILVGINIKYVYM